MAEAAVSLAEAAMSLADAAISLADAAIANPASCNRWRGRCSHCQSSQLLGRCSRWLGRCSQKLLAIQRLFLLIHPLVSFSPLNFKSDSQGQLVCRRPLACLK